MQKKSRVSMFAVLIIFCTIACAWVGGSTRDHPPQKQPTQDGQDLPQTITDTQGVEMALIPAGEFRMGDIRAWWGKDGKPVHTIYLDAFYMDIYEVTNAQYARCQQAGACSAPVETFPSSQSGHYGNPEFANYPVVFVDWQQAQAFCEWRAACLPTEAQWEKAARGGLDGKMYPWGDEAPVCQAGAKNGAQVGGVCATSDPLPVGYFAPNGYGLYDMAGNVTEWVADWYDSTYYSTSPAENPPGPTSGTSKVLRTGGRNWGELILHVGSRSYEVPGNRGTAIGFRCAAPPQPR